MTFIYTLSDGENIRYVGKTKYLDRRLCSHVHESKLKRTHKEKWINKVLLNGGKIIMEILEICDDDYYANQNEIYWIEQIKCWGRTLKGFRRGEMTLVTGATGSGKTTFLS